MRARKQGEKTESFQATNFTVKTPTGAKASGASLWLNLIARTKI